MKDYYVYILTNWTGGVMYIGITNNLERRLAQHRLKQKKGFSQKYGTVKLFYFEHFMDVEFAILREKEIKKWRREKKNALVVSINPQWKDLSPGWYEDFSSLKRSSSK